jgi:hypothetical protein
MTPDKDTHYSLLCETSYSEFKHVDGKRIVEDTIQGLINAGMIKEEDRKDIVDTWTYHADYSYPTPSVERDAILAEVIPYLEQHGIYSRGRFGMWKYEVSNTDHTLMQGVELVNRLLLDEPETTIGMKYACTDDGRNAAVHERSPVAGSGDPKRAAPSGVVASAITKTSPDATPALRTPGKSDKTIVTVSGAVRELSKPRPGGPGDKDEVHVSEEELGVTQNDGGNQS